MVVKVSTVLMNASKMAVMIRNCLNGSLKIRSGYSYGTRIRTFVRYSYSNVNAHAQ